MNEAKLDKLEEATDKVPEPAAEAGADRRVVTDEDAPGVKTDDLSTAAVGDADVNDPPLRSALPDEPVAHGIAIGQGAHTPPDESVFTPEGRPRSVVESTVDGARGPGGDGDETGRVPADSPSESDDDDGSGEPVPDDVSNADPDTLADAHSGDELRAAATRRELPTSGSKSEVAARLVEYDRAG